MLPEILIYISDFLDFETFGEYRLISKKVSRIVKDKFFSKLFQECKNRNKNPLVIGIYRDNIEFLEYCKSQNYTYLGKSFDRKAGIRLFFAEFFQTNPENISEEIIENMNSLIYIKGKSAEQSFLENEKELCNTYLGDSLKQHSIGPNSAEWLAANGYKPNLRYFNVNGVIRLIKLNEVETSEVDKYIKTFQGDIKLFPLIKELGPSKFLLDAIAREDIELVKRLYETGATEQIEYIQAHLYRVQNLELFELICKNSPINFDKLFERLLLPTNDRENLERLKIALKIRVPKFNVESLHPDSIKLLRGIGYSPEVTP